MRKIMFLIAAMLIFTTGLIFAEEIKLTTIIPSGSSSSYWTKTTSGDHIYNNNSGNVGIGITPPISKLDVVGSAHVSSVLNVGPGSSVANSGGAVTISSDANGKGVIQAANYGSQYTPLSINPNGGNVSIGQSTTTTTTAGKLIVNGTIDVSSNRITSVATPTTSTDAATKQYVDNIGVFSPNPMTGDNYSDGEIRFPNGYKQKWAQASIGKNSNIIISTPPGWVAIFRIFPVWCDVGNYTYDLYAPQVMRLGGVWYIKNTRGYALYVDYLLIGR